jgi:hypothetical protein
MGRIVGAFGTSHAFTFVEPDRWDDVRAKNRESLIRRRGHGAPEQPKALAETLADNKRRYEDIRGAHDRIRALLDELRPDAVILVGDDQHEIFSSANIPQLALYLGGDYRLSKKFTKGDTTFANHVPLAKAIYGQGIADGFDIASLGAFVDDELASHAHAQVLEAFDPAGRIPTVQVFLNAIYYPAIEPARCFALGQSLARAVERCPDVGRVVIGASGGWSHFTAGYPWKSYEGPFDYGAIDETFDAEIRRLIDTGEGHRLAALSSKDFLDHGGIEMRAWVAVLGAIGSRAPEHLAYQPFYRAVMGMGAATWTLA